MKEKITRVTLEDIRSGKLKGETDWDRVRAMTDEDIERAIAEDPDSDFDLANSTLVYVGKVTEWTPPPRKAAISIRLDEDVLDFFKSQKGPYQTHINAVLRSYMTASKGISKTNKIGRDARTGEFTTVKRANRHPSAMTLKTLKKSK